MVVSVCCVVVRGYGRTSWAFAVRLLHASGERERGQESGKCLGARKLLFAIFAIFAMLARMARQGVSACWRSNAQTSSNPISCVRSANGISAV